MKLQEQSQVFMTNLSTHGIKKIASAVPTVPTVKMEKKKKLTITS